MTDKEGKVTRYDPCIERGQWWDEYASMDIEPDGDYVSYSDYATLKARVAELEAQCVEVKPLVWWSPSATNNWTHGAKTIFGTYYVGICGGRHSAWAEFFHESGDVEQFDGPNRGSLLEAQMDAQAHHNARILSQVTTRSASEVWQEAIESAAKHMAKTQIGEMGSEDEPCNAWMSGNNSGVRACVHCILAIPNPHT